MNADLAELAAWVTRDQSNAAWWLHFMGALRLLEGLERHGRGGHELEAARGLVCAAMAARFSGADLSSTESVLDRMRLHLEQAAELGVTTLWPHHGRTEVSVRSAELARQLLDLAYEEAEQ